MAQKYSQEDISRFARTNPENLTDYQRRLARGYQRGLSRSQSRGHARRTERPVSQIPEYRKETRYKAPKIEKRVTRIGKGRVDRITATYSASQVQRVTERQARTSGPTLKRLYLEVFNPHTGKWISVYKGNRSYPHGITAKELLQRLQDRMKQGKTIDEALRDELTEASEMAQDSDYHDSDEDDLVPYDFTQVRIYTLA